MTVSIQVELKKQNPDYSIIKKKLISFINSSNKFADGKSGLLIGIYDATKLVQSRIIYDKDYGALEDVFKQLVNLDPLLFEARIWYAKSLKSNNKENKAIEQIEEALKINPSSDKAFRILIDSAIEKNDLKLLNDYCVSYLNASLGGESHRYKGMIFNGLNFNNFGVLFNEDLREKNEKIFVHTGINLNQESDYEIPFSEPFDLSKINLLFSFSPGLSLEIKNIILFSDEKNIIIEREKFKITSKNSFLDENRKVLFIKDGDEIINIIFNQQYKNIDRIVIKMTFKKLSLTSEKCIFNEKNN